MLKCQNIIERGIHCVRLNGRYYLTRELGEDFLDLSGSKDDFLVDDLIAEPVCMLNNKGYKTIYSCSGHVYRSFIYDELDEEAENEVNLAGAIDIRKSYNDSTIIITKYAERDSHAYISFEENIRLPSIPDGWEYDQNANYIRRDIELYDEVYDSYISLIEEMKKLKNWVLGLPEV